jgi:hypothetical protein
VEGFSGPFIALEYDYDGRIVEAFTDDTSSLIFADTKTDTKRIKKDTVG